MKRLQSFYVNLLLKLSLSQSILITIFTLWGCVPSQHIPAGVSGSFASLVQNGGRNSCHFIPDVLLQVHSCPWFPFVNLALETSLEEEVTCIEIGRSCRPFNIPSSWDHASWEHLVEDSHCSPRSVSRFPVLLKPESLGFNTKTLQLQFQKCAKHLSVAGWIYCY